MKPVLFENETMKANLPPRRFKVLGGAALSLSLLLHLVVICVLLFGIPAWEPEREAPPEVMMISFMGDRPSPPPVPEGEAAPEAGFEPESQAPADEPPPQPLPLGDTLQAVPEGSQEAGEVSSALDDSAPEDEATEESPPAKTEDIPLKVESRRPTPPKVSPPEVRKKEKKVEPSPQTRQLSPYEMITRSLGRDARVMGGSQGQADPLVSRYYSLIMGRIDRKWSPRTQNSSRPLEAFYNIVIEPDGRVSSARLVRSSGDPEFDRSVAQALRQSSPLSPPPSVFGGRRITVPLVFTHNRGRR